MTLAWIPLANYIFPECVEGKQKRRFLHKYLTFFSLLAYSKYKEAAYYKYYVVFAYFGGGVGQKVIFYSNLYHHDMNYKCYIL